MKNYQPKRATGIAKRISKPAPCRDSSQSRSSGKKSPAVNQGGGRMNWGPRGQGFVFGHVLPALAAAMRRCGKE